VLQFIPSELLHVTVAAASDLIDTIQLVSVMTCKAFKKFHAVRES